MHDKATSRHVPNKRQHESREENSLGHYFNALIHDLFQRILTSLCKNWTSLAIKLQSFQHQATPTSLIHMISPIFWPHWSKKSRKTFLGRIIICCQEAVSSLNWSVAAISLNLFRRVVTTDMKYSSWISGLMWRELRSQSSSESVTVRGMFRLNPTRIANPSWMMA